MPRPTGWGMAGTEKIVCDLQFPRGGAPCHSGPHRETPGSGDEADEAAEQALVG